MELILCNWLLYLRPEYNQKHIFVGLLTNVMLALSVLTILNFSQRKKLWLVHAGPFPLLLAIIAL